MVGWIPQPKHVAETCGQGGGRSKGSKRPPRGLKKKERKKKRERKEEEEKNIWYFHASIKVELTFSALN